ncbi:glycosyltransferase family A protein [Sphingomonas sp. SUN039]|uniref:glycosyltransferase family 2 protein n=1 Tax=Sphingomonas sp. SUN039 TaxID=2937787 RepID=UPI002164EBA4|nr:glycosyltransferase family A protein [Sphingomonas sp. SUN039]UVO52750.1 glycosyltransferase family 2 protein [Sphingomonas sp. SUN039]
MSGPRFSVIIPAYNAARTIGASIATVRAQSFHDLELIVIDDGSTDATVAAARAAIGDDIRCRVISKGNGGVSAARNLGADMAAGQLLAFLDADDLWHEDKLSTHAAFHAGQLDLAASFARVAFVDGTARTLDARSHSTVPEGGLTVAALLGENPVCTTSNLVVDRAAFAVIGGFDSEMRHAEDQEWQLRAVTHGHRIEGIDQILVGYRNSEDGLSVDLAAMHRGWMALAARYGGREYAGAQAVFCRYLARRTLRSGAPGTVALGYAWSGLRAHGTAYFDSPARGLLTFVAALASPLLPAALRARLFA